MSAAAKPAPRRRRRRRATKRRSFKVFGLVGQIATLVGLATGILSLVFIARPGCEPQAPPDVSAAEISAEIEHGVRFGYYLDRTATPRGTLSQAKLDERGVLVIMHFKAEGHGGQGLPVRWQLFDTDSAKVDAGDALIKPHRNTGTLDAYAWVTPTNPRRQYRVVATVFQPDGRVALDSDRTEPFPGLPSARAVALDS
jgi:hypothetical protein